MLSVIFHIVYLKLHYFAFISVLLFHFGLTFWLFLLLTLLILARLLHSAPHMRTLPQDQESVLLTNILFVDRKVVLLLKQAAASTRSWPCF